MLRFQPFQALLALALLFNSAPNPVFGSPVMETCIEPPPGLVSCWPGDGNADDIVGVNYGTLQNGTTFDDEFNGPTLNPRWSWYNENAGKWSLTALPGSLRIIGVLGDMAHTCNNPVNLLLQSAPSGDFELVTKLSLNPTSNFQQGGLIIFNSVDGQPDLDNYVKIDLLWSSYMGGKNVEFLWETQGALPSWPWPYFAVSQSQPAFLKLAKSGTMYTGYYSSDGQSWTKVGSHVITTISSSKMGIFALTGLGVPGCIVYSSSEITVDFDFFHWQGNLYSISGQVHDASNNPIPGVVVSASSGDSAITGVSGYFTITNLIIGTYTITPTKSGYTFSPASRTITVPPDATGQDFIGNAGDVTIDPATRTVENSVIKIRWDLTNAERVQALYFKPFNTSQNLGGSHAVEFIGNASAFDPTNGCTPVNVLVADRNTNSSWQGVSDGQTANVEIASISEQDYPVTTRFVITANSPVIRVERTFGFGSKSLSSSNLQTYALRGYNRNNFYRYAWQRVDGSVETSEEVCECACTPSNWGQTWIDLEAPAWNVGLALINLPSNPTSMPWLDKDIWSQTAYISAMVPRVTGGFSQDLTVSYLIVPHLGDYTALGGFYFVSGRVTNDGNTPISGVVVSASSGSSGITNADGHYTITNLLTGTYTITPTLDGYRFAPITRTVTVPPSKTEQNFIIRPAIPTPFLNPPIANSTVADALRGSTNGGGTGRVNAWFDHSKPIYTRDTDNLVRNYVGTPVPESCNLGGAGCYNGHSGTDFNKAAGIKDNPILAAAAGVVTGVVRTDNGGYGVQLWIDHENGYATLYGHLKANSIPVTLTNGTRVNAGQQIGIMGNTGRVVRLKGDGTHLHFGVYYDVDGDRRWTEFQEPNEVVDPFGWMDFPNQPSPPDPWSVPSFYLWIHQIYSQTVAGSSGITLSSPSGTANVVVPIGALTSTVTLQLMDAPPVAEASAQLRSTGRSFWLRVLEWLYGGSGNGLASIAPPGFAQPVTVTVAYSDTETLHLNESQLTIYRWNESGNAWTALATTVDVAQNKAVAQSAEVGNFDLQAPLLCPADVWEPNDNYYAASLLTPNSAPESQLFDIEQDEDWLRLDAVAGGKYVIWTGNLAAAVDTTLQMYDTDGLTLLDSDDNSGGGNASRLEWYAPASGTYFVRVIRAPGSTYGCSASYSISATQELRLYLPRILKNVAY